MGATGVGPSKMMIRSVNLKTLKNFLETLLPLTTSSIRQALIAFAKDNRVQI
jgi:signal transduction protein with GAF and PtsI domain